MKFSNTDRPCEGALCQYRIDPDRRMRIEEYQGRIGLKDLKSIVTAMGSDPAWSGDYHGLIDFSRAELDMSVNDVLRLSLLLRQDSYRSRGWLAFAVGSSAAFGTIRMLGYWSRATDRSRIFATREEAEEWILRNANTTPPGMAAAKAEESPASHASGLRLVG